MKQMLFFFVLIIACTGANEKNEPEDTGSYSDGDIDADTDTEGDTDADTDTDGDGDGDTDTDTDGDGDADSDTDTDTGISRPTGDWRVLPIRSEQEYDEGEIGGAAEQHNQGIARSLSDPEFVYLAHDCGQVWRSVNNGDSWQKTLGKGLHVIAGQSIEVDPRHPNIVIVIMDNSWNWLHEGYKGIYRSENYGDDWEHVFEMATHNSRRFEHNLAYDPASVTAEGASQWYAASYDSEQFTDSWLYRSEDHGRTWTEADALEGSDRVYSVQAHQSDGETVYVATTQGLFVSRSRGTNLEPLGDLPQGAVSSIAVNPQDADMLYAVLQGQGLYRSSDDGDHFAAVRDSFPAEHVFVNPGYPDTLYLVPVDSSTNTVISHDGGATWIEDVVTDPAPGLDRDSSWKAMIEGALTGIVPNPENRDEAIAFSRATMWKTTDGGHVFEDASTLYTGYNCGHWNNAIAFDLDDPDHFALTLADVGMAVTENLGLFFERGGVDRYQLDIPWSSQHGAGMMRGTDVIVTGAGDTWNKKIVRTENGGEDWEIVHDETDRNLFISFHPDDPDTVYAGNKRSDDGGLSFSVIPYLQDNDAEIIGMCLDTPDIIYGMNLNPSDTIYRSDDRGDTWDVYTSPGWDFARHDSKPTFAADPVDCDRVYSMDDQGDLAVFDGASWTSLDVLALADAGALNNFVRAVVVDPLDNDVVYAGMHSPGIETIWRTTDAGATWESISENVPRLQVGGLNINPHSGELIFGSCAGNWIYPPPYASDHLIYDNAVSVPY